MNISRINLNIKYYSKNKHYFLQKGANAKFNQIITALFMSIMFIVLYFNIPEYFWKYWSWNLQFFISSTAIF